MKLSTAERVAVAGALLLLALQAAAPLAPLMEYRREVIGSEPWRALTAHLVHLNWPHALVNAAAWWVVARLFADELGAARQCAVLLVAALAVSAQLAFAQPSLALYRGFSGLLHALFFAGTLAWLLPLLRRAATRTLGELWLPLLLLAGGALKVALEQPGGSELPYAEWLGARVVPQAHLAGALAGALLGVGFGLRARRA